MQWGLTGKGPKDIGLWGFSMLMGVGAVHICQNSSYPLKLYVNYTSIKLM